MAASIPVPIRSALQRGMAIPAHPLALTESGRLDERRQRALTRYYAAAGAGGLAVGVHTTRFAIRDPATGSSGGLSHRPIDGRAGGDACIPRDPDPFEAHDDGRP